MDKGAQIPAAIRVLTIPAASTTAASYGSIDRNSERLPLVNDHHQALAGRHPRGRQTRLPMPPPPAVPAFTPKQGQYLAFIYAYNRVLGRPPAEADLQRHFGVTPPAS